MTPPELVEMKCPKCATTHWEIDSVYRGMGGVKVGYSERNYRCPACEYSGAGYDILRRSPALIDLDPDGMSSLSQEEVDYWTDILDRHFPDRHSIEEKATPGRPPSSGSDTVEIFVSYSHIPDDSYIVFKLVNYLDRRLNKLTEERRPAVSISCIRKVSVGAGWQDEVDEKYFLSAKYVLLMITPDYLASDYCRRQMNRAEERERMGSVKVIPVILRQVKWSSPALWELLPSKGLPVTNWPNREEAFADIAEGILRAIPAEVQKRWVDPSPPEEEW
jgi:TIR domain